MGARNAKGTLRGDKHDPARPANEHPRPGAPRRDRVVISFPPPPLPMTPTTLPTRSTTTTHHHAHPALAFPLPGVAGPVPAPEAMPATMSARMSPSPAPVVLLVDDLAMLRTVMRRMLEKQGYVVIEASGAAEALAAIEEHPVTALVIDFHLAGHRGDALYHAACELRPSLVGRALFMSGDPAVSGCYPVTKDRCAALHKPFPFPDLAAALARLTTPLAA